MCTWNINLENVALQCKKLLAGPSMRPSHVRGDKHFNLCINVVL